MIWQTGLVAALLATGAYAGIGDLVLEGMSRNSPSYERRMQEIAKKSVMARSIVQRQAAAPGSDTVINPDGTVNMTAWDAQVNSACIAALRALPEASNPSGTCVCYNLPALDNNSGAFEADLRLYRLGVATGEFEGIPAEKIEVGLRYRGATASPISPGEAADKVISPRLIPRQQNPNANPGDLELLQAYLFLGQVDRTKMRPDITMAELQALVMPVVTLSGTNSQNQQVSTNVSSNEAAFVAGVFSREVVMSSFTLANLAVEDEIARLKNGTTAFVLPGVQILIFPIGLIITSVWTVLGIAAYGYGTFCRYNFREQYRRRMLIQQKSAVPRF